MSHIQEEKIIRLQKLLVLKVFEKMYYKKLYEERKALLDAGLKVMLDKLNALTMNQNELYNEIIDINDESAPSSLQTIFEQQEGFETEQHAKIDSYQEIFEDIYKQISQINDTENRLINRYKIELQSIAYEVKQMKLDESQRLLDEQQKNRKIKIIMEQEQQDFQSLYNEEKEKLSLQEVKFGSLQLEFEDLQQILQILRSEKKNENINEQQIKSNLDVLVNEIKLLEEKCTQQKNEIKEKNKQLKSLQNVQSNLKQENKKLEEDLLKKVNNKDLSEGKQKQMQRENSRLVQVIERKEKDITRLVDKLEEFQKEEKIKLQEFINEIEELTKEKENLKQELITLKKSNKVFQVQMKKNENGDLLSIQLTERESELKDLKILYKELEFKNQSVSKEYEIKQTQKELNYQKSIHEKENQYRKQIDELKVQNTQQQVEMQSNFIKDKEKFESEALQYLNYKDEEIAKLRKQIGNYSHSINGGSLQSSANKENPSFIQDQIQQGNQNNNSVKDLQNLLIILSKDLRNKEKEIDNLKQQLSNNNVILPLQQYSQNIISNNYQNDKVTPDKRRQYSKTNMQNNNFYYQQNKLQSKK